MTPPPSGSKGNFFQRSSDVMFIFLESILPLSSNTIKYSEITPPSHRGVQCGRIRKVIRIWSLYSDILYLTKFHLEAVRSFEIRFYTPPPSVPTLRSKDAELKKIILSWCYILSFCILKKIIWKVMIDSSFLAMGDWEEQQINKNQPMWYLYS